MLKAANNSYFVSRHVKKYLGSSPIKQVGCKTVIIILKHFVLNIRKALIILVSAFYFFKNFLRRLMEYEQKNG